jgi:hypothetical protein
MKNPTWNDYKFYHRIFDTHTVAEIQGISVDVDLKEFLHFDDQLETQKIHDSAISMVEVSIHQGEIYEG